MSAILDDTILTSNQGSVVADTSLFTISGKKHAQQNRDNIKPLFKMTSPAGSFKNDDFQLRLNEIDVAVPDPMSIDSKGNFLGGELKDKISPHKTKIGV